MRGRSAFGLLLAVFAAGSSAFAQKPSFADLLAKAEAQAAAGHRWSPPGDNMTETVASMMDMISTATPQQLAQLSTLLEKDSSGSQAPATATPVPPTAQERSPALPQAVAQPPVQKPSPQTAAHAAEMVARGQEAERLGNVSAARRYYATAAAQGNATAALSLGRLYDPAYLHEIAIGGIDPDPALARHWYEVAAALGDPHAGPLIQALSVR